MSIKKTIPLFVAKFILPEYTPLGESVSHIHDELEATLLAAFESVVVTPSVRIYRDEEEGLVNDDVLVYEVLLQNTAMPVNKLKAIAVDFAGRMGQSNFYFQNPNGEVYYLESEPVELLEEEDAEMAE